MQFVIGCHGKSSNFHQFQMTRIFFLLSGCIAFVDSLNNFLVQGRADTLKVLRKIVRDRDAKV